MINNSTTQLINAFNQLPWYHPSTTRHIAESLLMQNGREGSYLMRPSSVPGEMALSVRCKDSVKHFNVLFINDEITFGLAKFYSMREFIDHFKKQPFIAGESGIVTWLKYPYPKTVNEPSVYDQVRLHAQYGVVEEPLSVANFSIGTKEGFMTKLGAVVKNWKVRWFVLQHNQLSYYRTKSEKTPLKVLDLVECKQCQEDTSQGQPNCFKLHFDWRIFYLKCETHLDFKEWMDIIKWKLANINENTFIKNS